jgi:hypothetical protein
MVIRVVLVTVTTVMAHMPITLFLGLPNIFLMAAAVVAPVIARLTVTARLAAVLAAELRLWEPTVILHLTLARLTKVVAAVAVVVLTLLMAATVLMAVQGLLL